MSDTNTNLTQLTVCSLYTLTDLVMGGPLGQQLSVVDSLSSRQDLLTPHEHVVWVGVFLDDREKKKEMSLVRSRILLTNPKDRKIELWKLKEGLQVDSATVWIKAGLQKLKIQPKSWYGMANVFNSWTDPNPNNGFVMQARFSTRKNTQISSMVAFLGPW